jgi:hypothetical protein
MISIRASKYRGKEGYLIYGSTLKSRSHNRIFVEDIEMALKIRAALKDNDHNKVFEILLGKE